MMILRTVYMQGKLLKLIDIEEIVLNNDLASNIYVRKNYSRRRLLKLINIEETVLNDDPAHSIPNILSLSIIFMCKNYSHRRNSTKWWSCAQYTKYIIIVYNIPCAKKYPHKNTFRLVDIENSLDDSAHSI